MTISATAVRFDDATMWVELSDGRTLGVPLAWFPRLLAASPADRERVEIGRFSLHWEHLDEDKGVDARAEPGHDALHRHTTLLRHGRPRT
ncbi:MAG TPA: DUF2442 domain-containing protein [Beijerinckiaceae bacterium]|jgi:hypothetical protein